MRRRVVPAALALLLVAILVVVTQLRGTTTNNDLDPSSISSGRAGTLALYTWLDKLGLPVHRIESSFDLSGTDVLLSIEPEATYTGDEVDALMAHLQSGGDAIVSFSTAEPVHPLLDRLGVSTGGEVNDVSVTPAQPFDPTGAVTSVPLLPPAGASTGTPSATTFTSAGKAELVPLLGDGRRPVAAALRIRGGGRIYLVGSTFPFSNDGLRRGDAAPFALGLIERARGGHVTFDEYHHERHAQAAGYGIDEIFRGPLLLAIGLATVLLLVYLTSTGRRLGRPIPVRSAARVPSVSDHIAAVAGLLSRSRKRGAIADRYAGELKQRIAAVSGIDSHLSDESFLAALAAQSGALAVLTAQLLNDARALAGADPSEAQLVGLARRVDQTERQWSGEPQSSR
ncbi:MAG: DUF4350 domain-containing protein [Candidatus Dormibacteria bacterium]